MAVITFTNEQGIKLSGYIQKPVIGRPIAFAIFAHCFTCTKDIKAAKHIADALVDKGIGVLRFDFMGLGSSEGDFSDSHFTANVSDIVAAAEYLKQYHSAPEILIGHSLGGTAVLSAAKHIPSSKAIATIGSPADADHILHILDDRHEELESKGQVDVKIGGLSYTITNDFVEDIRQQNVKDEVRRLGKALLVMHSPLDDTVSIDQASELFMRAKHPKSFVTLDNADHLLSDPADSRYAANVLTAWVSRYLDMTLQPDKRFPRFSKATTKVRAPKADGFLCTVNSNGHHLFADEPLSYGGSNLGPSPFDLLSSALGACTAMTLNMYARHKKLSVDTVEVSIKHKKIAAEDCTSCETKTGKIDQFERNIRITGDITDAQRERMIQIADRCPVHKTLHSEIDVVNKK